MLKVLIPQAFENMEEATLGRWLKAEGETIREGEALCELITEKTTFDLPAENVQGFAFLRKIVAPEKSIVPVSYCIALIGGENEALPEVEKEVESQNAALLQSRASALSSILEVSSRRAPSTLASNVSANNATAGSRVRATPAARRIARERGLQIEQIAAALPGKVLTEDDVRTFNA